MALLGQRIIAGETVALGEAITAGPPFSASATARGDERDLPWRSALHFLQTTARPGYRPVGPAKADDIGYDD
jgi:hypothetical protein